MSNYQPKYRCQLLFLNENLISIFSLLTLVLLKLFSELKMWDHRSGDFYQRQHATCSLGGWLPGYACEKGPSCWTNEATQTGQRGKYGLSHKGSFLVIKNHLIIVIITMISATMPTFQRRNKENLSRKLISIIYIVYC